MVSKILFNRANSSEFHRRVKELHTDKLGVNHVVTTDIIVNESGNVLDHNGNIKFTDIEEMLLANGIKILNNLIDREFQKYLSDISQSINPFRDAEGNLTTPAFSNRNVMLSRVLNEVCSSKDPTLFMKGSPYMSNLSDAELMFLMNISQETVDDIRAKVVAISDTDYFLSTYVPPIVGGDQ